MDPGRDFLERLDKESLWDGLTALPTGGQLHPKTREFRYLLTNLPRRAYSSEKVGLAYRLRWQIELLFKEWKSYANLHVFATGKSEIAEGLIWGGHCGGDRETLSRSCDTASRRVEISTRKVAMCARHVIGAIVDAIIDGHLAPLCKAIEQTIEFRARNAQRAHPKRDRKTGRLQLGLLPVFGPA